MTIASSYDAVLQTTNSDSGFLGDRGADPEEESRHDWTTSSRRIDGSDDGGGGGSLMVVWSRRSSSLQLHTGAPAAEQYDSSISRLWTC